MSNSDTRPVLVAGATGKQGGAVVRALLQAGRPVRAMTRDPASSAGQTLAAPGVEVVKGDFNDIASLDAAMAGVAGVFSMQMPSQPSAPETEVTTGKALIDAADRAGVDTVVHTSVARAGDQKSFVGWDEGRWDPVYWNEKAAVIEMVKAKGFRHWTVLKPALIMENLIPPMVNFMFPAVGDRGLLESAINTDTRLDWIAATDIGAFAAAAFADPERFHGQEIDLAAECTTLSDIAYKLTKATGRPVSAVALSRDEMLEKGYDPRHVQSHEWDNVEGYKVDLAAVRRWGVPLTTLDEFVKQNRNKFVIG